jgi:hypothetical protein
MLMYQISGNADRPAYPLVELSKRNSAMFHHLATWTIVLCRASLPSVEIQAHLLLLCWAPLAIPPR